jgi:hypothetical protein
MSYKPEPRSLKPGTPYSEFNDSADWFAQEAVDYGDPPAPASPEGSRQKKNKPKQALAFPNVIGLLLSCWQGLRLFLFFTLLIAFGITLGLVVIALSFEVRR